jgi:hypothetical protein
MESSHASATALRQLSRVLGIGVAAVGSAVLLGWMLDLSALKTWPALAPFMTNTAAVLVAAGAATALQAPERQRIGLLRIAQALAIFVVLMAGLTLLEYVSGRSLGIDDLVLRHPPGGVRMRMGLPAAVALFLIGLALLLVDFETRNGLRPAQVLALVAALIPLQAIIAYCYGIEPSHGKAFAQVSLPTGTAFAVLCASVLLVRPEHGIVRIMASAGPAGFMARRLLVAIVLLPILLGWVFLVVGLRAGQYETMVGASLVVLAVVVMGAVVVWWNARAIQRVDEGRTTMEETLRAEREWFRTTLASIGGVSGSAPRWPPSATR